VKSPVAEWLSEEWLQDMAALADARPPLPAASGTVSLAITAGRGREVGYHWHYRKGVPGGGSVGVAADADVVLTMARDDAWSVLTGEMEPSVAFMRGRLKATGDGGLLLAVLESTSTGAYREWRQRVQTITEATPATS
jgi:SCP-2 sterol transfer family